MVERVRVVCSQEAWCPRSSLNFGIAIDWAKEVGRSSGLPTTTHIFEHLIEGFTGLVETVVFMAEVYYSKRTCSRINKGENSSGQSGGV